MLITGGAGFLGSHLCDRFLAEGHTVIAMDNLITGNTRNIAHLAGNQNFSFIRHDTTNYIYIKAQWMQCYTLPPLPARLTISSCQSKR